MQINKAAAQPEASSSFRVLYYGGASGAVPFTWESHPGTPKHHFSISSSLIPPLTPPPSYQFITTSATSSPKTTKSMPKQFNSKPSNFLSKIFPRVASKRNHVSPSLSSPSMSSSCYSGNSYFHQCLSHSKSTSVGDKDDRMDARSQASGTLCFGIRHGFFKEFRHIWCKVNSK